jgi:hypothetical protein
MVMENPADLYENPEDVTLDELEEEGYIRQEPCTCKAGQREAVKDAEEFAVLEQCLIPGKTMADLPDGPYRLCDYFDMEKFAEYHAKFGKGEASTGAVHRQ